MSHFAKVINGIVEEVIVAEQDFIDTLPDKDKWIQTSYNTRGGVHYIPNTNIPSEDQSKALRKNYAGVGYTYDVERDAFIQPKPFGSWILNEQTCIWEPPFWPPESKNTLRWDEESLSWVETT
jgi:hypothetical protein